MRIALGLHSRQLGGSQLNTVDLGAEMRRRGHDVRLWAIDAKQYEATIDQVASEAGFDVELVPAAQTVWSQATHVRAYLDRVAADVVHVHHENHWLGPVASVATRSLPRTAVVVTNWMMEHTHYLPRHAPLIVGFEALAEEARRHRPGPVWVLEPPVNIARDRLDVRSGQDFRDLHDIAPDEPVAAVVARIDHDMKYDAIVQAIRAVELGLSDRLRLVIVGDGNAMEEVRARAVATNERLGRNAVVLTGALADPRPAYAGADVILGMGGSALRGLAFGKPVIVHGGGTFSLTFDESTSERFRVGGFFGSDDNDPTAEHLARRISALLDPAVAEHLGELGRTFIANHFSLDALGTRLEHIYREASAAPLSWRKRWMDVLYVSAYERGGRALSPTQRQAIRARIPALRGGKATWT